MKRQAVWIMLYCNEKDAAQLSLFETFKGLVAYTRFN